MVKLEASPVEGQSLQHKDQKRKDEKKPEKPILRHRSLSCPKTCNLAILKCNSSGKKAM